MTKLLTVLAILACAGTAWGQAEAEPPDNLQQFLADGITVIPEGGSATSTTIVLSGTVHGSGATQVRIEVEIRPVADPFLQVSTHQGPWVNINTTTSVTVSGLIPGAAYHWQATTVPT